MNRRNSSRDVAKLAGVSQTTVSFILNGHTGQSFPEETRSLVWEAARKLKYKPNRLVGGVIRGETKLIGVIVPEIGYYFYSKIAQGMSDECLRGGYRMMLTHSKNHHLTELAEINRCLEHRVDGLICVSGFPTAERTAAWMEEVIQNDVHCVMVDDGSFAGHVDTIIGDDFEAARQAVNHLIERGHRRIGHIMGYPGTSTGRDRFAGYRAALSDAGVPHMPELVAGSSYEPDVAEPDIRNLLDLTPPPTAIFAANDDLAARVYALARGRGLRVPEDLAIVGYGDHTFTSHIGLTSVCQQPEEIGRLAIQCFVERIQSPDTPPRTVVVPTRLLVRESSAAARS